MRLLAALLLLGVAGCGSGAKARPVGPQAAPAGGHRHSGVGGSYTIAFPAKPEQAVEQAAADNIGLLEMVMYTDTQARRVYGVLAVHRGSGRVISADPGKLFDSLEGTLEATFRVHASNGRKLQVAGLPGREVDLVGIDDPSLRGLGRFAVDESGGDLYVLLVVDDDAGSSAAGARFFASFALTPR